MSDMIEQTVLTRQEQLELFGKRLREIRRQRGMTQIEVWFRTEELAKRENCPEFTLSDTRLSLIENGRAAPGPAKLLALATVYGLSVAELVAIWSGRDPG